MLTLPLLFAVASAGVVGGVHCVGMCGGVARLLAKPRNEGKTIFLQAVPQQARDWQHLFFLHAGRLSLYALLGAIVGGVGAAGMWLLPVPAVRQTMFILGNLALIMLGLRLLQLPLPAFFSAWQAQMHFQPLVHVRGYAQRVLAQGRKHPFLIGMAWGCLPCGLLFAVLPFALLSSSIWGGASLMLVFGLASLPHLLLLQTLVQWGRRWQVLLAVLLLAIGGFGLWHFDMQQMPGFLCVTA